MNIRDGTAKDLPFTEDMLFETIFWDPNNFALDLYVSKGFVKIVSPVHPGR